jgi:hypothetical protein
MRFTFSTPMTRSPIASGSDSAEVMRRFSL